MAGSNKRISELTAASGLGSFKVLGNDGVTTKTADIALFDARFQAIDAQLTTLAGLTDDQIENLTGLAGLDDTPALVEKTDDGEYANRPIGIAGETSIPTRGIRCN